jgi:hypothetical protein
MKGWRSWLGGAAAISGMAILFWVSATLASSVASVLGLGVNVHGLSLPGYAAGSARRLAPLASRIIQHARQDAGQLGHGGLTSSAATEDSPSVASSKPSPTPAGLPNSVPSLPAAPLPPVPAPLPPVPAPVAPVPAPTPAPTLLPLPLPSVLPLPSALPLPSIAPLPTGAPNSPLAPLPSVAPVPLPTLKPGL